MCARSPGEITPSAARFLILGAVNRPGRDDIMMRGDGGSPTPVVGAASARRAGKPKHYRAVECRV
jgi:hypothetical protein